MHDLTPTTEILPPSGPVAPIPPDEMARLCALADRLLAENEAREREAHRARGYLLPEVERTP